MNKVKQIAFIGMYVAIIVALQTLLSSVNGIELTTLLFTVAAVFFPLSVSLSIVVSYCLIEGILFGFGDWVILYLVYWSFVVLVTFTLKRYCKKYTLLTAILNAVYGFLIGVFFFFEMIFIYGLSTAISYYLTGLQGDILHLVSNFFVSLILFPIFKRIIPKISIFKIKKV